MSSMEVRVCDVYDEKKLKIDTREDGENYAVCSKYLCGIANSFRVCVGCCVACANK